MATFELKLPDLGEGVVEGEIVKWLVKEGDTISEDQVLVEVMTDKATVSVPSPRSGKVVKTHGLEGEVARVHHPLVTLELEGAAPAELAPPGTAVPDTSSPGPAKPPREGGQADGQKVLATPVTRRMAREHGLNLSEITGSGAQGRVTKADVVAMMEGGSKPAARPGTPSAKAPAPLAHVAGDERVPLRGLRKKIAEKMVRSKFTAPHFTFVEEVDATALVSLRKRLNEALAAKGDATKLSFLPFICKALVSCLRTYPSLNANMDEAAQELILKGAFNFGMAVATPEGLTVPVLKSVDQLSIRQLSDEIARLGNAARDRKLKMEELSGGGFTITSLGQTGGLLATPIINHPEVAILGIHRMRKQPRVVGNDIVIREVMNLSLSFDHRVIDGSVGAEFTYALIRLLEHPELLFLELV